MHRLAMKDYTFSDGTFIPKGTVVGTPIQSIHADDENYERATTFNPWRFSDARAKATDTTKYAYTNTSPDYLSFGYGRHSW